MPLQRYRVAWTNFSGAPGISTHYLSTSVTDFAPIRTFYNAIKDLFPNGLQFQFPNTIDVIDEATGTLTGSSAIAAGAVVTSTAPAAAYSGASGAVLRWTTALIKDGKRVVGRTYLVPLATTCYFTDGTLVSGTQTTIQNAGNAMLAAYGDGVKVWARPFAGAPGRPARAGSYATALSALVPDLAAVLRSRRQ